MIYVTRLNHTPVVLNCDLIEHMETTPDTVISLTTGQKLMVLESAEEIIDRVIQFRRFILYWSFSFGATNWCSWFWMIYLQNFLKAQHFFPACGKIA